MNRRFCYQFIVFLALIPFATIKAQSEFLPGCIIRLTGDTVFGSIDSRNDGMMAKTCKFKPLNLEQESSYSPSEIAAYKFSKGTYYISKEVDGKKVFLEYLIKGKLNVYLLWDGINEHYYLEKEGLGLTELPYEEGTSVIDGLSYKTTSSKHKGILNVYMQDAPNLQHRIQEIGKPETKALVKLAKDYHNQVCTSEKCIVYEKTPVKVKIALSLIGGTMQFRNTWDLDEKHLDNRNYNAGGVLMHFSLPHFNQRFYFKTGLIMSEAYVPSLRHGDKDVHYWKIPLQIEYCFPNNYMVRPFASFGLLLPSYSLGSLIRISKRLYIGVQGDVNFLPYYAIVPKTLNNWSVFGSLHIELN